MKPPRRRGVRVQLTLAAPDGTTRFVNQVVEHLPADVTVRYFSWRSALTSRYDVLHIHWPEALVRGCATSRLARLRIRLLLGRLRLLRTPVLRTLHNLEPHEDRPAAEARWLTRIDEATTAVIRLNDTTPVPADAARQWTVLHGDYRDRFGPLAPDTAAVARRILFFGLIRPYKGLEQLLDGFAELSREWSLRIVGRPMDAELKRSLTEAAAADARISLDLRFVPDPDLVAEITAAEVVVLPYQDLHNSGAALVALSLNRPIVAPDSASIRSLAAEVGEQWIHRFTPPLTAAQLADGLTRLTGRDGPSGAPALSETRRWPEVGRAHAEIYRTLTATRGSGRRDG